METNAIITFPQKEMLTGYGDDEQRINYSAIDLLEDCHANQTLFKLLKLEETYDLDQVTNWRESFGIGDYIENMKNKVRRMMRKVKGNSPRRY